MQIVERKIYSLSRRRSAKPPHAVHIGSLAIA
jgi:hypothetical protein